MNTFTQGINNTTLTENGAITFKSTGSALLDLFYHGAAKRSTPNDVIPLFVKAFDEDILTALKIAFYIRDVRGGQGEREVFRKVLRYLADNKTDVFNKIVPLVPKYGRWDDLISFVDNPVVVSLVQNQLSADVLTNKPSLLAKWMPSENASAKATRALARKWCAALNLTVRNYRLLLVSLREKIKIVETLMSAHEWSKINYENVPSRASMIYRKAFKKHDGDRYTAYLEAVTAGEKKINASTLYPYDLVNKARAGIDPTIEAQWSALPNYVEGNHSALVIVDVSGSMFGGTPQPVDVAVSLGLYIAERNTGAWHNLFMTFSDSPEFVKVTGKTLHDKVQNMSQATWTMNTNLQAAFNKILSHAEMFNVPAEDMPKYLFVVSDMEFDDCTDGTNYMCLESQYKSAGYDLPKVVFWNVQSRNKQTQVTMNQKGVYLVSGCSPSIFRAAINAKAVTPLEMMLDVINVDRYLPVEKALDN